MANFFARLKEQRFNNKPITKTIEQLSIELVLTTHPTEIACHTLIHKLIEVNTCLAQLDHDDLVDYERNNIMRRLLQLIAQCWYTDEIRKNRPTPIDKAKWGFAVVENLLWDGIPAFLRELNEQLETSLAINLPVDTDLICFASWMSGDRNGNPFVTADVTREVLLLSCWKATEFFLADIQILVSELSMSEATPELRQLAGGDDIDEPYRQIAKNLCTRLRNIFNYLDSCIKGETVLLLEDYLHDNQQLWQPLYTCYQSLIACGMSIIANGQLLDTLQRIRCFGLQLVRIDIRQENSRHTDALAELLDYPELGDYKNWSKEEKQTFLLAELSSKPPLCPKNWQPSTETQEVLDTYQVIANAPTDSIAAYVISMAKVPSDVLAVKLLLKEGGCSLNLPWCRYLKL